MRADYDVPSAREVVAARGRPAMPKKAVEWVALALSTIIVLALAGAFLIPQHPEVTRSIDIDASPEAVFAEVGDLRRFNDWSSWTERDPQATFTFTGPIDGEGQTMRWESRVPALGSGAMTVERIEPGKEIEVAVRSNERGRSTTRLTVEPDGATTSVTWRFTKNLGFNPVNRYLGMGYEEIVGPDLEAGLTKLKTLVETPPEPPDDE